MLVGILFCNVLKVNEWESILNIGLNIPGLTIECVAPVSTINLRQLSISIYGNSPERLEKENFEPCHFDSTDST